MISGKSFRMIGFSVVLTALSSKVVFAAQTAGTSSINSGDTAWILISTALVMLMTPGLALFYGGMVRSKNVLATILQSMAILGLVSLIWVLWGYTLAFGPDKWEIIGSLRWLGLRGITTQPAPLAPTIPHLAFVIYQGMFAAITPALITGALAERVKFSSLLLFTILWSTLVYAPVAHWVWGGGWIAQKTGALDFAGGTVVHINSAIAAFVAAWLIGKRKGYLKEPFIPHNLPMTIIGASLLWFGWFGFNGGSALRSNALASLAFLTTNTSAAAAALSWVFMEWIHRGKPTALGFVSGAVAGLVAITPGAGFVSPLSSLFIGLAAGLICYFAVELKPRFGYDDSLDVLGIHGVGGFLGALLTGVFASLTVNASGANGLIFGNFSLLRSQFIASAATIAYSFVVSFIILMTLKKTIGLRVSREDEVRGLDITQHSEAGYNF